MERGYTHAVLYAVAVIFAVAEVSDGAGQCGVDGSGTCTATSATLRLNVSSCDPFKVKIGSLSVCPIMNGVWTSFVNHKRWGKYSVPLSASRAAEMAAHMIEYDRVGLNVWIGEDFDARVLSALFAHYQRVDEENELAQVEADEDDASGALGPLPTPIYSIIVEMPLRLRQGAQWMRENMAVDVQEWVQVGPPALEHMDLLAELQASGAVGEYGVEDYDHEMLETISKRIDIVSVQQEINLIIRPSRPSLDFCQRKKCAFIAYGALLGGLLSDAYLGADAPSPPDPDHRKQTDYLASINQWGDWEAFQKLLAALRKVADRHAASIAQVALRYTLDLPYVAGAIVGVRLGNTDHRAENLAALGLRLSREDNVLIEQGMGAGRCLGDGLART